MKLALLITSAALLLTTAIYQIYPSKTPQKALMTGPILYSINAAAGSFQLTATSLMDAWCSCN
jgi:hypothetical protein